MAKQVDGKGEIAGASRASYPFPTGGAISWTAWRQYHGVL